MHIYSLILAKFGTRDIRIILASIYEFRENRYSENSTFLMDVDNPISCVYRETAQYFVSKERLGKGCVPRRSASFSTLSVPVLAKHSACLLQPQ